MAPLAEMDKYFGRACTLGGDIYCISKPDDIREFYKDLLVKRGFQESDSCMDLVRGGKLGTQQSFYCPLVR